MAKKSTWKLVKGLGAIAGAMLSTWLPFLSAPSHDWVAILTTILGSIVAGLAVLVAWADRELSEYQDRNKRKHEHDNSAGELSIPPTRVHEHTLDDTLPSVIVRDPSEDPTEGEVR